MALEANPGARFIAGLAKANQILHEPAQGHQIVLRMLDQPAEEQAW